MANLYEREVEARENMVKAQKEANQATIEAAEIQRMGAVETERARAEGKIDVLKAEEKARLDEEYRQSRISNLEGFQVQFLNIKGIEKKGEKMVALMQLSKAINGQRKTTTFSMDNSMEAKNEEIVMSDIRLELGQISLPTTLDEAYETLNYIYNYRKDPSYINAGTAVITFEKYWNDLRKLCADKYSDDPRIASIIDASENPIKKFFRKLFGGKK